MVLATWVLWGVSLALLVALLARDFVSDRLTGLSWRHYLYLAAFCIVVVAGVLITALGDSVQSKGNGVSWGRLAALYLSMVAGTIAQFFYYRKEGAAFSVAEFVRPVLASPIVFVPLASAYQDAMAEDGDISLGFFMLLLVAFQQGFIWKAIFDQQIKTAETK